MLESTRLPRVSRLQAFPLPVEGTETTVVSDSPEVQKYMVDLNDALEKVCMIRSSELPNS